MSILERLPYQRRVRAAVLIYLFLFFGLNLYVWITFFTRGHDFLHSFPLGDPVERFGDLLRFSGKYQIGKDPRILDTEHLIGTLYPTNYPPFADLVFLFLVQVCAPYAIVVLLATFLAAMLAACISLWRKVRALDGYTWYIGTAIFATGFFSWATLQVIVRGNIEGLMWIAVCLGAVLLAQRRYRGAAAAFGVATALKPHPVLWFALMARHRRYREAAFGLLVAAVLTLLALLFVHANPVHVYRNIGGEKTFFSDYIVAFRPITGDHSLLQSMKFIGRLIHDKGQFIAIETRVRPNDPVAIKLYPYYLAASAVISLLTLKNVWNRPMLNQIFALACLTTLLPPVSGAYTLTGLLAPMGFFLIFLLQDVATGKSPLSLGQMLWFVVPFAWIMATEPLIVLHSVEKCIAVLVLLGATLATPLPSTLFGEVTSAADVPDDVVPTHA